MKEYIKSRIRTDNTNLQIIWNSTHQPYEITAIVSGEDIVFPGCEETNQRDKILHFVTKAYTTAYYGVSENVVLLKNGIKISPENIISIKPID